MSKKTVFNVDWMDEKINPQWSKWVREVKNDPFKAHCIICCRSFSLSNMGRQALQSHDQSVKHKKNVLSCNESLSLNSFFRKKDEAVISDAASSSMDESTTSNMELKKSGTLDGFISKENVLKSEIIWALKLVTSQSSMNSFKDASSIFKLMFPDSKIAELIAIGSSKMSYLISFGLSPYFSKILRSDISDSVYVICFDEALNKISQKGQMDLCVRYWSKSSHQTCTRYLNSTFLGHSTAEDLIEKFYEGINDLDIKKMIQISMDGPNVNLKMARCIKENLATENSQEILDLGTCGLHVVHGAFRCGHAATKWSLNSTFRALYLLFKNSPARHADFISITESNKFPLKFCEVRWLENVVVADRAIEVFNNVKKYVNKSSLPKTHTVETIKKACEDKLIFAKMAFFSSVAILLQPFLKEFQTNNPVAPYLYESTHSLIRQLMKHFVKSEIMEFTAPTKYLKIDINDATNICTLSKLDLGIIATGFLAKSNVGDREKREFRQQCLEFLRKTTSKILERSPLKFLLVKHISSLNPKLIISNVFHCEKQMEKLLQTFYDKQLIASSVVDRAKEQFSSICQKAKSEWKSNFQTFSSSDRLDVFYRDLIGKDERFKDIWEVMKIVLILSHGNASVESGFSINKDLLVENLTERSLIALRTVYDSVKSAGGIEDIEITKEMLTYAKMSRMRYHQFLDEQKKKDCEINKRESEKRKAVTHIKFLKEKKAKLSQETEIAKNVIDIQIAELSKNI